MSSKLPDMLSLPPIEASSNPCCASFAPKSAAKGSPQRSGSVPSFSKYSWNVKWIFFVSPPPATIFATESVTAQAAAW